MRKIIGFRTFVRKFGNMGGDFWWYLLKVSLRHYLGRQSTAYNSYLMRDVHRQFATGSLPFKKRLLLLPGCRSIWRVAVNDINK